MDETEYKTPCGGSGSWVYCRTSSYSFTHPVASTALCSHSLCAREATGTSGKSLGNSCCAAAHGHQSHVWPKPLDIQCHLSLGISLTSRIFSHFHNLSSSYEFFSPSFQSSFVSSRPQILFGNYSFFLPLLLFLTPSPQFSQSH